MNLSFLIWFHILIGIDVEQLCQNILKRLLSVVTLYISHFLSLSRFISYTNTQSWHWSSSSVSFSLSRSHLVLGGGGVESVSVWMMFALRSVWLDSAASTRNYVGWGKGGGSVGPWAGGAAGGQRSSRGWGGSDDDLPPTVPPRVDSGLLSCEILSRQKLQLFDFPRPLILPRNVLGFLLQKLKSTHEMQFTITCSLDSDGAGIHWVTCCCFSSLG